LSASAVHAGPDTKPRLRLWVRLLRATRGIEAQLRERIRTEHGATLPRFDVLSALARHPQGLMMSELSRQLMVSNGNVTGIVERLATDGLVHRTTAARDRRRSVVTLTEDGRTTFDAMATEHEQWINELLGDLSTEEAVRLSELLERVLRITHPRPERS
jgi:DNA-binding MarR family transcriptional regulator